MVIPFGMLKIVRGSPLESNGKYFFLRFFSSVCHGTFQLRGEKKQLWSIWYFLWLPWTASCLLIQFSTSLLFLHAIICLVLNDRVWQVWQIETILANDESVQATNLVSGLLFSLYLIFPFWLNSISQRSLVTCVQSIMGDFFLHIEEVQDWKIIKEVFAT